MTKNPAIQRAIASIPDSAWTPVRYPGAVQDPDTGAWISDTEVAEVPYTAFAATQDRITARLVVRRVNDARYPTGQARCSSCGATTRSSPTQICPPRRPTSSTAVTRSSRPCSPT
jgi:hypothetical protein